MDLTGIDKISIAFYNLENFFDTYDDPNTADDPFTPKGFMHWVKKRFENKSKKIVFAISQIGLAETGLSPVLIGLAEVENKRVIKNIIKRKPLKKLPYGYVHFESADRRGMDVALLYRKDLVQILQSKVYPLTLYNDAGEAYNTRDILYVKTKLFGETIHIIINHWPSRREGDFESDYKRYRAAEKLNEIVDYIYYEQPEAKFVLMGDFNTDPDDAPLIMFNKRFFNPAQNIFQNNQGSLNHQNRWHLFDQIMFSRNFLDQGLSFDSFHIFKPSFLKVWQGKHKNQPFRTYRGRHYQAGYSDHFPVYALLIPNTNIN